MIAHVGHAQALANGPPPAGNLAVPVFARGTAVLYNGTTRRPLSPGAFAFVSAGQVHRFEDFSADFAVRVFFYGPDGGEAAN